MIGVLALRANNQHMIQLREAVYVADRNNQDVQAPLQALRVFVTSHMNTNLSVGSNIYPPIQLKYTYERLLRAQQEKFAQVNSQLYIDAQSHCEQQNSADFSGRNRVPCIEEYVQGHNPQKLPEIPAALYKFSFVSPRWSPDLAGFSLLTAVFSLVMFVLNWLGLYWLRLVSTRD